jgi:hypothetical protein
VPRSAGHPRPGVRRRRRGGDGVAQGLVGLGRERDLGVRDDHVERDVDDHDVHDHDVHEVDDRNDDRLDGGQLDLGQRERVDVVERDVEREHVDIVERDHIELVPQ